MEGGDKNKRNVEGDSPTDRLSELPEPILHMILCSLSQKAAVQTSVLSKPWRHRWCARPKIAFRESYLTRRSETEKDSVLSSLATNLLFVHDQNLCVDTVTLHMSVSNHATLQFLLKWIPRLTRVKLLDLSLRFPVKSAVSELPPLAFDSGHIEKLYLRNCVFQQPLCFSSLRRLSLKYARLTTDLFSSCSFPCLEWLTLYKCYGANELNMLSTRSMKHLDITNFSRRFKATVDAPSIVRFHYHGVFPQSISFAPTISSNIRKFTIKLTPNNKIHNFFQYPAAPSFFFNKFNGLLEALSQSEISLGLEECMIHLWSPAVTVGVSDAKLPVVVERLVVNPTKTLRERSHLSCADFLINMFHIFRPKFIRMNLYATNLDKVAEILLKNEREIMAPDLEGVISMKDKYSCKHVRSFALQWKGMANH